MCGLRRRGNHVGRRYTEDMYRSVVLCLPKSIEHQLGAGTEVQTIYREHYLTFSHISWLSTILECRTFFCRSVLFFFVGHCLSRFFLFGTHSFFFRREHVMVARSEAFNDPLVQ